MSNFESFLNKGETVIVGMSGGVDSAVSAYLLKKAGYNVLGVFMKNWDEKDENGVCTSEKDWTDVQRVCDCIDIPYYSVNFVEEYLQKVFKIFIEEYKAGRTPNPDVLCNKEIKFKAFLDYAVKLGAKHIATGHFVQREDNNSYAELLKGVDPNKDQSYFLYMLNQQQLKHGVFPVGAMCKNQVREIAESIKLPVSTKKDSTGVCFIGERNFKKFLQNYFPAQKGIIRSISGEKLGEHDGLMYYTLGQRRGLGIGGCGDGRGWFVVDKDLSKNELLVSQGEDSRYLYSKIAYGINATWIKGEAPVEDGISFICKAKYRYRQPDQDVNIIIENNIIKVESQVPQRAVTPGQSVVFYNNNTCLGGAIIKDTIRI